MTAQAATYAVFAIDADTLFTVSTVADLDGTPVRYVTLAQVEELPARLVHRRQKFRVTVSTFYVDATRDYYGLGTFPAGAMAGFDQCAGTFTAKRDARAVIAAELARVTG